jgi:hypothetical protein
MRLSFRHITEGKESMRLAFYTALSCASLAAGSAMASGHGAYHMYRLDQKAPSAAGATMEYFGGQVLGKVTIEVVIWGSQVASTTVTGIGPFLQSLANSTYVDQLAQYDTGLRAVNGRLGTNQKINRGTLLGQTQIAPKNTATTLTGDAIVAELAHQITIGKLPRQTPNTLYMIYFPPSITITLEGGASCQTFGAYHQAAFSKIIASNVFYGVMPDCGGGFTEQTVVSSHEFAEAMTDGIPTPGSNPAFPQAWNTSNGYEIGDLCESNYATLTAGAASYQVQEVFDNATNACGTGNFSSP